jgi:hypothetical protein
MILCGVNNLHRALTVIQTLYGGPFGIEQIGGFITGKKTVDLMACQLDLLK